MFHNTKYYSSPRGFINSHLEEEGHRNENLGRCCCCFNIVFSLSYTCESLSISGDFHRRIILFSLSFFFFFAFLADENL